MSSRQIPPTEPIATGLDPEMRLPTDAGIDPDADVHPPSQLPRNPLYPVDLRDGIDIDEPHAELDGAAEILDGLVDAVVDDPGRVYAETPREPQLVRRDHLGAAALRVQDGEQSGDAVRLVRIEDVDPRIGHGEGPKEGPVVAAKRCLVDDVQGSAVLFGEVGDVASAEDQVVGAVHLEPPAAMSI